MYTSVGLSTEKDPNLAAKEAARIAVTNMRGERIDLAIAFEKDTLLFFYELLNATPAGGRKAARAIIEEEKLHVLLLSERARQLAAGA